jgi:hypothetical protein
MMNELAAARKLLEDAKRSFTSLRATHRLWRDIEILKERGRQQISEASGSLDAEDLAGYEPVEHEGQSVLVRSADSRDGEWHSLLLSRGGTRISINSMLDRETSIAIAHSLRPVKAT